MQDLIRSDASFTPRELFARMQGAWFEPRQGSMWQETTGITPTTTAGQIIGLILGMDKGQPPTPGTELIVNGDGSTLTGWTTTLGSGSTITPVDGEFRFVSTGGLAVLGQTILTSGQFYSVAFSYRVVSGAAKYSIGGGAEYSFTGTGTIASIVRADGTQFYISRNFPGVAAEFYIDNISIKDIPGNHATATNRPTLQYNGNLPLIRFGSNNVLTASLPNLGGGVFSSAGSVYFSTPQGMSCLHNQSIGTSYNLPALQTDVYGIVITPARLAPPLEQRLALYMHRLAGLADADFFWQEQATDGMEGQLLADDNDTILLRA